MIHLDKKLYVINNKQNLFIATSTFNKDELCYVFYPKKKIKKILSLNKVCVYEKDLINSILMKKLKFRLTNILEVDEDDSSDPKIAFDKVYRLKLMVLEKYKKYLYEENLIEIISKLDRLIFEENKKEEIRISRRK